MIFARQALDTRPGAALPLGLAPVDAPPAAASRNERRRHARTRTYLVATVNFGPLLLPCFVVDLSAGGAKVKMLDAKPLPDGPCELECGTFGKVAAEIAWARGGFTGLRFATPITLDPQQVGV